MRTEATWRQHTAMPTSRTSCIQPRIPHPYPSPPTLHPASFAMGPLRAGSLTLTYYSIKPTDHRRSRAPALIHTSPWADEGKKALSKQNKQRQISP